MDHPVAAGSTLGRYRLIEEIGRGGMAVVYRAEDPTLGREVAIKVLLPRFWGDAGHVARFVREARAVARLHHGGIVEVYDFGVGQGDESPGFIVAELLNGPTLRSWLDQHGALLPEVAMIVALKLAEALAAAHAEGVIHRDLKPDNVIIADGRRVVLTDFGIARLLLEGESLTQTGALVGSPAYMSPEQARGLAVDERSDLFSLGTVLYEMGTGRLPFAAGDPIATAMCIVEGHYRPPQTHDGRISTALAAVIDRLLQGAPQARYPSAAAVVVALRRLLDEAGLGTPDEELAAYLAGPRTYDERLARRVIRCTLAEAQQAASRGQVARALSLCDRVLAHQNDHRGALQLIAQLSARRARWRVVLVGLPVVLALVAVVAGVWRARLAPSPGRPVGGGRPALRDARAMEVGPTTVTRPTATSRPTPAALPDATLRADRATPVARGGRGRRWRETRRRAAGADAASIAEADVTRDDGGRGSVQHDAAASPGPSRLLITIGPWCDAFVDGRPVGRSPMARPLTVTPGRHQVVCRQPDGARVSRTVTVAPGALQRVGGPLRRVAPVRLQLSRGDAVRVAGRSYRSDFSLPPKRYRIDLLRDGRFVEGDWVTVPPGGCRLVDRPRLDCR